ncbi:sulfurtransferase [Calothrix sp. PCC 6303]|uniref:sulfurtransferase n=1 Tax=Calothrix sp. PCC 6303 TaxID=1170562 RepID=UPI0002A056B9|nr:sulfurtransferase [Calothrix sp. PCC 6303]AFZ00062.1 3-mercaptopyruvate sulfurtransferase [Calothrix sp. PCC 6303]
MINKSSIISAQSLFENRDQVVIIDCRFSLADSQLGWQQYQVSHIPGAYYLNLNEDLSSPVQEHGGRHPLPKPEELGIKLAAMGVDFQKTLVVAYDDSRFAFASRLWWLLRYLGHQQVAVLDGGFAGWMSAGYPVTDVISEAKTASFIPQVQPHMVVDIADVKKQQNLAEAVLVDSRERDRYHGIHEPIDKIAGHIPGAVNYPWQDVTDNSGYAISPELQRQRWQDVENSPEIIVYCGSGVTACVNLLALDLAEISTGKLYAGSWSDWISYE